MGIQEDGQWNFTSVLTLFTIVLYVHAVRYPEARAMNRKIIFHAGPTNSGKTYHALERFKAAKSGIYCGPLKLLAAEVYSKTNEQVSLVIRIHWTVAWYDN